MGRQIMGTEHHTSEAEIAERTIDFIENLGMALLPWQAEALRAMLTYPVSARFYVATPQQRPSKCPCFAVNGLAFDWRCGSCGLEHKAIKTQARGSRADYVVMDEPKRCNTFHLTVDDIRECPEHGQGH
jgi:hypothetical protein